MIKNLVSQEQLDEAVDDINGNIESVKTDVDDVEKETVYGYDGTTYMGVSNGKIAKMTYIPPMNGVVHNLSTKDVVHEHDEALAILAPIGTTYSANSGNSANSVPNNINTKINSMYLPAGKYIVRVQLRWESGGTTGQKTIGIQKGTTAPTAYKLSSYNDTVTMPGSLAGNQEGVFLLSLGTDDTIMFLAHQDTGSDRAVALAQMVAYRIL